MNKRSLIFGALGAQGAENGGQGGCAHSAVVASAWTEFSK